MINQKLLQRPIYGGVFGHGRYSLATMPCISRGLHSVRFMVIERAAGAVLSIAEDKREALAGARHLLRASESASPSQGWQQGALWQVAELPASRPMVVGAKKVSRRRREVFEKSMGRCHYCRTPLTLDGQWHVEHMVPQALNGSDEPLNLVAACSSCNLAKSDKTALEYVLRQEWANGA